jgi:hypothetical protein
MYSYTLSKHAQIRANQRAVLHSSIDLLFTFADIEIPAGGSCSVIRLSRKNIADGEIRRLIGSQIDRLRNIALVFNSETREVVTILHDWGKRGRKYRRRN